MGPMNHTYLFNGMIYPFTRIVIYGAIWYQVKNIFLKYFLDIICYGETNAGYNIDKYNCSFSKMIGSWRTTWNERTNGLTDIQFPFGFVQVSLVKII
jgi:hypothetical protein